MDHCYSTIDMPERERGQHLNFESRCSIQIFHKLGYSLRRIAAEINCSASTVLNELRRGTKKRKNNRGRNPIYSARRGEANYQTNRTRCHKPHKIESCGPFVQWVTKQVKEHKWSLDACVGYAKKHQLFPEDEMVSTKTLYNELWAGNLPLTLFDVPEALSRKKKGPSHRKNKRVFGKSIEERPEEVLERIECGHWEIDTVEGHRAGKESVVLTLVEKRTEFYLAIKIPGKDTKSVMAALEVLREECGPEYFPKIFQTITSDNGEEFAELSELEKYGVQVYFAHPYSPWERPQNERHIRLFRRYVPKGKSIENYSEEQILMYADEMNSLPRKQLNYSTPEELFEEFLNQIYQSDPKMKLNSYQCSS